MNAAEAPVAEAAPVADATTETAPAADVVATEAAPALAGTAPKGAIFTGPDNHIIHDAHQSPKWVKLSPFIAMLLGLMLAIQFYILRPEVLNWPSKQNHSSKKPKWVWMKSGDSIMARGV